MRLIMTAGLLALALCACGGEGGGAGDNYTISPYYPDDAPHLKCDESDGQPCCDPPVGEFECPEGTTFEIDDAGESSGYRCEDASGSAVMQISVYPDGSVGTHGEIHDGGYAEVCDQETGKVLRRSKLGLLADNGDDCTEYCATGMQCSSAPCP